MAAPGWHPDPFGRHEHRFFDGTRWTDQAADSGATATDPLIADDQAPPPGEGPPPGGAKGARPVLLIGLGVVVAVGVAVAAVLFLRTGGSSTGAGDFSLAVKDDEATIHELNLKAGDLAVVQVAGRGVRVAVGVDKKTHEKLSANVKGESGAGRSASEASDFYSDVATDIASDSAAQKLPGFDGAVLSNVRSGSSRDSYATSVFGLVGGKYYVLMLSKGGDQDVKLKVRVKHNPVVKSDLGTDDLTDLDTDVYTDFVTDVQSEFSDQTDSSGS